jgi:hypothetical protein
MKRYLLDFGDPAIIVVSKGGSDATGIGSWTSPVATLAKALNLVTNARSNILMLPGQYDELGGITWPDNLDAGAYAGDHEEDVPAFVSGSPILVSAVAGPGSVVIGNSLDTTAVITIAPIAADDFELSIKDIEVYHTDGQKGIKIDNTNCAHKLIVNLDGLSTSADETTDDSILVVKGAVAPPIRIYAKNCDEIEGLVTLVVAHTNDRYQFTHCKLLGGIVSTGAVAGLIVLLDCVILTGTYTIDSAQVITTFNCVYVTDHDVYSAGPSDSYSQ